MTLYSKMMPNFWRHFAFCYLTVTDKQSKHVLLDLKSSLIPVVASIVYNQM